MSRYTYHRHRDLTPAEFFLFIAIDETKKQLGINDLLAASGVLLGQNDVLIAGTSSATRRRTQAWRRLRPALRCLMDLRIRLPMITRIGVRGMRIAFTRNLGAFVGRTIPVASTVMLSADAIMIMLHSMRRYNDVASEDRLP